MYMPKVIEQQLRDKILGEFTRRWIDKLKLTDDFFKTIIFDFLTMKQPNSINTVLWEMLKKKGNWLRLLDIEVYIEDLWENNYTLRNDLTESEILYLKKKFLQSNIINEDEDELGDFENVFLEHNCNSSEEIMQNISSYKIQQRLSPAELVSLLDNNIDHLAMSLSHISQLVINKSCSQKYRRNPNNLFFLRLPKNNIKLLTERVSTYNKTRRFRIDELDWNKWKSEFIDGNTVLYLPI